MQEKPIILEMPLVFFVEVMADIMPRVERMDLTPEQFNSILVRIFEAPDGSGRVVYGLSIPKKRDVM